MNYYNEFDPKAAAWLRELIAAGVIAEGIVDQRSILDVRPADLDGYAQCHFFAGIGGWSHALRLAAWPDDRPIWTGSCPCQPFSDAGLHWGTADKRHLWPMFFDLISQCRPSIVVGEQVASKAALVWLDGVCDDLEGAGYAVGAADLCAAGAGSPQIRQRLYWLGNTTDTGPFYSTHPAIHRGEESRWPRDGQSQRSGDALRLAHANKTGRREQRSEGLSAHTHASRGNDADRCCEHGRLADADGRNAGAEGLQRSREQGQRPEDGATGGMGESSGERNRPAPLGGSSGAREIAGRERSVGGSSSCGRVGDAEQPGLEGLAGHGDHGHESGRLDPVSSRSAAASGPACFWSPYDLIPCTDGAQRRIEPSIQPLVDGLPRGMVPSGTPSIQEAQASGEARVARLRGYGNSIVPQLAAEFVKTFLDLI